MKVAVSVEKPGLDVQISQRFGRCSFFAIVDTESMEAEFLENPGPKAMGGAGIKAGQLVVDAGAKAVITGRVGPNAQDTLNAGKIDIYMAPDGTVKELVERLAKGELPKV